MSTLPDEAILHKIYRIREQKVMLDSDLAALYGVETKALNQAVKRNRERFPEDFMFELTQEEFNNLRSHFVTSTWGGRRYPPNAFTEQGVAMLSSVLTSATAIAVNIRIIRVFTRLREILLTHKDILLKLQQLAKQVDRHDTEIRLIFDALKRLMDPPQNDRVKIGYRAPPKIPSANRFQVS